MPGCVHAYPQCCDYGCSLLIYRQATERSHSFTYFCLGRPKKVRCRPGHRRLLAPRIHDNPADQSFNCKETSQIHRVCGTSTSCSKLAHALRRAAASKSKAKMLENFRNRSSFAPPSNLLSCSCRCVRKLVANWRTPR